MLAELLLTVIQKWLSKLTNIQACKKKKGKTNYIQHCKFSQFLKGNRIGSCRNKTATTEPLTKQKKTKPYLWPGLKRLDSSLRRVGSKNFRLEFKSQIQLKNVKTN